MKNRFGAIEVGIFAVVSLIFLNSAYNLFTDGKLLDWGPAHKPLAGHSTPSPAKAEQDKESSGAIAGFVPYETKCMPSGETFETNAAKVRILGPFCGASPKREPAGTRLNEGPTESKIENTSTRYQATVFSDVEAGKFSTDFIPLSPGENKILMEFRYKNGKLFPVELTIMKK